MGLGMASDKALDALLDLANIDGGGSVNYGGLAQVLSADDVMNVVRRSKSSKQPMRPKTAEDAFN